MMILLALLLCTPFGAHLFFRYVVLPIIAFWCAADYQSRGKFSLIIGNLIFWPVVFFAVLCVFAGIKGTADFFQGWAEFERQKQAAHHYTYEPVSLAEEAANDPNWFLERKYEFHRQGR